MSDNTTLNQGSVPGRISRTEPPSGPIPIPPQPTPVAAPVLQTAPINALAAELAAIEPAREPAIITPPRVIVAANPDTLAAQSRAEQRRRNNASALIIILAAAA